eukprot:CAMPEP_0181343828 /NCGR_PEP_ID=MMETSP1101-20121128/31820_1 /TAXON_ID=46948 /ORGANISM="Rhodomonas abbreviata, Strain Caron Lab Isolate" /LENGTH=773 /DNA_ID=CAMNT_0023455535 /DNA_START=151 /DNA_END=2469 /DNA_ORIENTATION=+
MSFEQGGLGQNGNRSEEGGDSGQGVIEHGPSIDPPFSKRRFKLTPLPSKVAPESSETKVPIPEFKEQQQDAGLGGAGERRKLLAAVSNDSAKNIIVDTAKNGFLDTVVDMERRPSSSPGPSETGDRQKEWVSATWYASQEACRRRGSDASTASVDFAARRMHSLHDVMAVAKAVKEEPEVMAELVDLRKNRRSVVHLFRDSYYSKCLDVCCTIFLVFGMDVYLLASSPNRPVDNVLHIIMAACLVTVFVLYLVECQYNKSRSAVPYLVLEFLSILSFLPALLHWGFETRITTERQLTLYKFFAFTSKAGKVIRLTVVAVRVHLSAMYNNMKKLYSGQKWTDVFDKNVNSSDSKSSSTPGQKKKAGKDVWQVSMQLHRHVEHQTVTLLFLFLLLLLGFDMLTLTNEVQGAKASLEVLKQAHAVISDARSFEKVATPVYRGLYDQGLDIAFLELHDHTVQGSRSAADNLRYSPPSAIMIAINPTADPTAEEDGDGSRAEMHLDIHRLVRRSSIVSIFLCCTSILVVGGATLMMHTILQYDIIIPIERMIELIGSLAHEPLAPLKRNDTKFNSTCETRMVENAIFRFAGLLQVAFGEAGANVIRDNMIDGVLNKNMCGKVIHGLFGFCDVRNFTTITEILQGDVVRVINGIAEVVHGHVVNNYGAPNKNIGDAFLMVWKPKGEQSVEHVAACMLSAYVKICMDIAESKLLRNLSKDIEGVEAELNKFLPDSRLHLGFGMHYGWAVECAIGSFRKIDASYLSPHVNFASRLEAATKQ